ncbi:MAG: adenylyltransferase/cytidyltransferase family protein [Candidatus Pacearchaeota archaeon]
MELENLQKVIKNKLKNLKELKKIRFSSNKKMVFLPGCFDVLHPDHFLLFAWAKSLGDYLVVATNSDDSIRKLKGKNRPVVPLKQRIIMLASNGFIDYIIVFKETNTVKLLKALKPQVYAKGSDYVLDKSFLKKNDKRKVMNQEERKIVESYGGEIKFRPGSFNYSTTKLLKKIQTFFRD